MSGDAAWLAAFWEENRLCEGKPFRTDKPRAPVSMHFDDHFLMGLVPYSVVRYHSDAAYQEEVHRQANDILEAELGRRFYPEIVCPVHPKRIEFVFGAWFEIHEGSTPWLANDVRTIDDVRRLIDRVEREPIDERLLPEGWEAEVRRFEERTGGRVAWGTGGRGPVTVGTSVLGAENLCLWMVEEPETIGEFYSLLARKYVEWARFLRDLSGFEGSGWWVTDDDSCLISRELYEQFCEPVLRALFEAFAPGPDDRRYQHSDSAMGHLMPVLRRLGVNGVNLGPTIHPADIRAALPEAVIEGQIPPFLLRNGTEAEIRACVRRDFEAAGLEGGLVCTPAGSYAEGTPFENLRAYLRAVQELTRYDR